MLTIEELVNSPLQEKEILVEGILGKGDLVCFAGRRKNGKTTLLFNLAFSLAEGKEFLGHKINRPCKTILCLLEDSEENCKKKAEGLIGWKNPQERVGIINSGILARAGVRQATAENVGFVSYLRRKVEEFKPDLLILDNISKLVRGNYNDAGVVDKVVGLVQDLALDYGCAVILAAHMRKINPLESRSSKEKILLASEEFFEDVMGSSHLTNSVDCLWGILARNKEDRTSYFLGGMQRYTGEEHLSTLELGEDENFHLVGDRKERELLLLNTSKRRAGWKELGDGEFSLEEAKERVKSLNKSAFWGWWKELVRMELVEQVGEDLFRRRV